MSAPRNLSTFAVAALLALSACGATLVSERLDGNEDTTNGLACQYEAGAYALPLDMIHLEVWEQSGDARYLYVKTVDIKRTADRNRTYCLDFLGSVLSDDKVSIQRGKDDGNGGSSLLLEAIGSEFDDKSIEIADEIVKAAVYLATPRGGILSDDKTESIAGQFDFDPFNERQMRMVNDALEPMRQCVFLDRTNDPYVPAWHDDLCKGHPSQPSHERGDYYGLSVIDESLPPVSASLRGVLYKPQLTHKLVIMQNNDNPGGPPWRIFETRRVQMTNAAPAFMLEVDRSAFVKRTMSVDFDKGVLQSVSIDKPSEAEALSRFVLRTVQSVIAIPVRAVTLGRLEAQNRKQIIATQDTMIQTLRQYNAAVEGEKQRQAEEARIAAGGQPQRRGTRTTATATSMDGQMSGDWFDECVKALNSADNPVQACDELLASGGSFQQ